MTLACYKITSYHIKNSFGTVVARGGARQKNQKGSNYKLEGSNFFLIISIKYLQGRGISLQGSGPLPAPPPSATGCNGAFKASFDSSRHSLPPKMLLVWWFGKVWPKMNFFFSLFLPRIACQSCKKSYKPFNLFFSLESVPLLLFVIFFIYIDYF